MILEGMGPPPSRRPEAAPHYPSLERSARKKQKPGATSLSTAAIIQAALRPESRSMESLGKGDLVDTYLAITRLLPLRFQE